MIRVEGHKHLYRTDDGGIVNTDTVEYNQYMRLKINESLKRMKLTD